LSFDICIVGSGASGAIAARALSNAGLKVVVLEVGRRLDNPGDNAYRSVVKTAPTAHWYLNRKNSGIGYPWSTSNLGGGTVFYGGASFRYSNSDFNASKYLTVHDLNIDWPIALKEFYPYYDAVEDFIGVSGGGRLIYRDAENQYLPPVAANEHTERLFLSAKSLGLSPVRTPLAINTLQTFNKNICQADNICIENICPNRAKADMCDRVFDISGKDKLTVLCDTFVVKLVEKDGKVQYAEVKDKAGMHQIHADYFILAANAIQSAALLLRSRGPRSSTGIANSSGLVGRGLCFKPSIYVEGEYSNSSLYRYGPFSTFSVLDYVHSKEAPFQMGGLIYEAKYGLNNLYEGFERKVRLECLLGEHPSYDNKVSVLGLGPEDIKISYSIDYRDRIRLDFLANKAKKILKGIGINSSLIEFKNSGFEFGSAHLHGTLRFGEDPRASVLNAWCRTHDVRNLFAIDGSFMPFPGNVNPTLTIQANALRVSHYLLNTVFGKNIEAYDIL
jgi:paromamine 6'-oxidase/6'''-hydroxyneomycin C oxidase/2'-deamino-2'-hydroxyparomamine 6'-oxidase